MATGVLKLPAWRRLQRRRSWRLLATALGFASFGFIALLLSLSVFPVVLVFSGRRSQAWTRRLLSHIFRVYLRWLRWLGVLSFEVHNPLRLLARGQLVIANHPSLLDAVFLLSLAGDANCVVKGNLWRNPFTALGVRAAGYLSNARADLVAVCTDELHCGNSLIIFPEGTRSRPAQPLRFHRAPFRVALAAACPIVPVVVKCEPATLLKNQKWYELSPSPPHYSICAGEQFDVTHCRNRGEAASGSPNLNAQARILTAALEEYFEARR